MTMIETTNKNDGTSRNDPVVDDSTQHDDGEGNDTKELDGSPTSSNNKDEMTKKPNENDEKNSPTDRKENNEYDIVIVGTGLVESILSCALTMQHFKVLHIDEQEYYGQQDASLTLGDLIKWSKQHYDSKSFDSNGIQIHSYSGSTTTGTTPHYFVGQHVLMNPYGRGIVIEYTTTTEHTTTTTTSSSTELGRLVVELVPSSSTTSNRSKTTISFQWKMDSTSSRSVQIHDVVQPLTQIYLNTILNNPRYDRMCAFDLNSTRGSLVLSNGMAVSSLLKSKVSEYLEFKAIDKLQIVLSSEQNQDVVMTPVPCHKSDVFNSKLLQPLEKRKLMKLLQLVLEYEEYVQEQEQQQKHEEPTTLTNDNNETTEETKPNDDTNADNENIHRKDDTTNNSTVTSATTTTTTIDNYNERHLQHRGKSLKRPQNKKAATSALQTLLDIYITPSSSSSSSSSPSFEEYLIKEHKMSSHLISIICHALCLSVCSAQDLTVADGFHMLSKHMNSLGKFGSTAFITPLYGCGELSQAYCRKSAVLGTTYMLRQSLQNIHYSDDNDDNNNNDNDDNKSTNITGVTLTEVGTETGTTETAKETTEIKCSRVILGSSCNTGAIDPVSQAAETATRTTTLNRISLLYISDDTLGDVAASVIQNLLAQSLIVVVPSDDKKNAVFITFKNHLVNVCCPPSNYIAVHMSTISTDTSTSDQNEEEYMKGVLQNVVRGAIGAASSTAGGSSKTGNKTTTTAEEESTSIFNLMNNIELFHVCYSTRTPTSSSSTTSNTSTTTNNGLYKVKSPMLNGDGISIDGYFQKAKQLFDHIMKDGSSSDDSIPVFLEMSTSLQKELEEAQKGYGGGGHKKEEDDDDDM